MPADQQFLLRFASQGCPEIASFVTVHPPLAIPATLSDTIGVHSADVAPGNPLRAIFIAGKCAQLIQFVDCSLWI